MSRGDIILRLVDVERIYETKEGRKIVALNKVTTSFKRGEFVAVVGKSGSGKSTLINILGGLDRPDGGDYFLEGNNISNINEGNWDAIRNQKIGFIFQEYHLIEYLSVYKNVEIALKYQRSGNRKTKKAKIKEVLTQVGIADHMHKLPSQLSGGQRQRVAVARALVKDPAIILADEPTGALDHKTSENVIELIKGLSRERLVIVVTHDRGIANEHATRIIEIAEGRFTSDLVREEIEQTYQNTYRKTAPTNLSFWDKLELTFRKIKSQLLRTFFTALSLALAFSFTILFNGVERGITDAYDAYFEALNKANSYAFSFVPRDDIVSRDDYVTASNNVFDSFNAYFEGQETEIVAGYSSDVAYSLESGAVEYITTNYSRPDILEQYKLRLIDVGRVDEYSYDDLFLGQSDYPYEFNEVMVTSSFYRNYFQLSDDIVNLTGFIGTTIDMPMYTVSLEEGIYDVDVYMRNLVEIVETGQIVEDNPLITQETTAVRFLPLRLPNYCYYYEDLDGLYQTRCDQYIEDETHSRYFDSVDEFIDYMDDFKTQVNSIDPDYFDLLFRSNAIYYVTDEREVNEAYTPPGGIRYIQRVYQAIYDEAEPGQEGSDGITYTQNGLFKDQLTTKEMTITAIIENDNESIVYMDVESYNKLFEERPGVELVTGYYSVNLESGIQQNLLGNDDDLLLEIAIESFANPLNNINSQYQTDFKIIRKEYIEQGEACSIYELDNVINQGTDFDDVEILGDVFTITDYSSCKVNSESYHYLSSIRILFGVFFNVLMLISIIFFNILLQVILGERISEIGIYRSVGSTSKDIKILFFIEIFFEVVLASAMSIAIIVFSNQVINAIFISVINQGSGVINFAGMKLSIGNDQGITNISFFNLAFYIGVVFILLGFLSNRNVSKLANTKPIDILREVD